MCAMVSIDKYCEAVCVWIEDDLAIKYQNGITKNLISYVLQHYPSTILCRKGQCVVDKELLKDKLGREYFEKTPQDFSARDFAYSALNHMGMPPVDSMSLKSLEKRIRAIFDTPEYSNQVYIKLTQGGKNVACLSSSFLDEIISHKDISELIKKQILRAENNPVDSVEWNRYELEKAAIAFEGARAEDEDIPIYDVGLTKEDELYYMVKALFSLFFTDFDFQMLEADLNEYEALDGAKDFGERYQHLNDLLSSPNFNWKYYSTKTGDVLLEKVAEKIAEKVVERMNEK